VTTTRTANNQFASREATGSAPKLVITTSSGGTTSTTTTSTTTSSTTTTTSSGDPVIVAGGDIACGAPATPTATTCQQTATADLAVAQHPDALLPLGDDQYELGSQSDYQTVYAPSWGRLFSISHPVPGNHEYGYIGSSIQPTGGQGYFTYFGDRSHPLQPGCTSQCTSWYSWDIGGWHLVALDSQCGEVGGCGPGTPQFQWLLSDLNATTARCVLAYWHIPIFSSSQDHQPDMSPIFQLLYAKGADVVLNGHAHFYERFAPQDAAGNPDPARGLTQFVVGTGGRSFFPVLAIPAPNSRVLIADTFGVLRLRLRPGSYQWSFLPVSRHGRSDSGTARCH